MELIGAKLDTVASGTLTYDDTGLTNNQDYYYRISANSLVGAGPVSVVQMETAGLIPVVTGGSATFDWTDTLAFDASTLVLDLGSNASIAYSVDAGSINPTTGVLTPTQTVGTTDYTVTFAGDVMGAPTAVVSITVNAEAPNQVAGLVLTPGDGQIGLVWAEPTANGAAVTTYDVERSLNGTSGWDKHCDTGNHVLYRHRPDQWDDLLLSGACQ